MWLKKYYSKILKVILCMLMLSITAQTNAQPPSKFYCRYGGNGYDVGYDVKQTLDGGYIITGSTSSFGQGNTDMYLLKLDSMGQKKFETSFGGYSNEIGKSIVQLTDSSYVMVGYTSSTGVGGYDVFLVKADKNGALLWQKTIGGNDWDFAYSLQATTDGGFIIAGTTYSFGHGNADGYIIKTDANGNTTWTKTYGGLKDDEFKSVIQTADGNYALTGYSKSYNDSLGDVWVFKIDLNGDSLLRKFYGGNKEDFGNEIIEHPNGNFYIAGATESFGLGMLDAYSLKLDNSFNETLHQFDGHPSSNEVFHSVVVPLGNPSLTAYAETDNLSIWGIHPKLLVLNAGLGYVIATGYGDTKDDEIFKIIRTKDYGFACIGYTKSFNAILSDIFFIKTDSTILGSQNIVSVKENEDRFYNIDIYPNPCLDYIYIQTHSRQIKEIQLIDLLGNIIDYKISKLKIENERVKLDLNMFTNGIYYIKINSSVQKIIIDR
jgi:hypothetical protein